MKFNLILNQGIQKLWKNEMDATVKIKRIK